MACSVTLSRDEQKSFLNYSKTIGYFLKLRGAITDLLVDRIQENASDIFGLEVSLVTGQVMDGFMYIKTSSPIKVIRIGKF